MMCNHITTPTHATLLLQAKFAAIRAMPPREEGGLWSMEEEVMLRDLFCKAAQSGNGALLCKLK